MKKSMVFLFIFIIFLTLKSYSRYRPIGFFDVAHTSQGCQGWALDPDNPYANITVHFYANAPVGSAGSVFIGSTIANGYRPDVNSGTGYPGNHGFLWVMPISFTTPCRLSIYAYAIDLSTDGNPNLNNSPRLMPYLEGSISNYAGVSPITITANSRYAGAIYSLIWNGKQFINSDDHGRELQSACGFYSYPNSWANECYNPTEAGSEHDGNSGCTDSRLLNFSTISNILTTKTQMAFWARPGSGTNACTTGTVNSLVTSNHILEKIVQIGVPNIPHAIKYQVSFTVPTNETYLALGQFEVVTGYLTNEFNVYYRYNQFTEALENANSLPDGEANKPVVLSTVGGNYAMGIYSPEIARVEQPGQGYGQFQYPGTNKWNFVRRISNIQPGATYTFTAYIAVGSLENVRISLSQLISTYPNP